MRALSLVRIENRIVLYEARVSSDGRGEAIGYREGRRVVDGGMTNASNKSDIHGPSASPPLLRHLRPSYYGLNVVCCVLLLLLRVTIRISNEDKHHLPCDDSCGWSRRGGIAPRPKEPVSFA